VVREDRTRAGDDEATTATLLAATRDLLWIGSAADARRAAEGLVRDLGGRLVSADAADPDALPVDVSFSEGRPTLPAAPLDHPAHARLARYLPGYVRDAQRAVELAERTQRLAEEASIDPLTGLANRRAVGRALGRLRRDDVLVVLDLDAFKQLNDSLGHAQGDAVLRALGRALVDTVRVRDLAGRLGGEEFLLILRGADDDGVDALLSRLRATWERVRPHPVTFSAGIARVGDHPRRALREADEAMYEAKTAGRDRWRWAHAEHAMSATVDTSPGYVAFSELRVPAEGAEPLVRAFADRLGAVDGWPGFRRLEVWREPADATRFVMVSWWDREEAFRAYMGSDDHRRSHARIVTGDLRPRPDDFRSYRVVAR
jgi:diguanylate cyclase (GGDEF)-like protein